MQLAGRPVWRIDIEQVSGSYMSQITQLSAAQQAELQRARDAINAIPTGDKKDFEHLRPLDHAAGLPTEAGPLRRIIETQKVRDLVEERKTASRGASQSKAAAEMVLRVVLLAITVGAAFAFAYAVAYLGLDDRQEQLFRSLIWICFLLAGFAAVYAMWRSWKNSPKLTRNSSEKLRRDIMHTIVASNEAPDPATEIATVLLQVEYFRRFQLDAQIDYYATRIGEENKSGSKRRYWKWSAVGLFILMVFAVILLSIGAASEQGHWTWAARVTGFLNKLEANSVDTWVIAFLLGATAIYVFLLLTALQFGDHRSLYGEALAGLIAIKGRELDGARAAAAQGNPEPMRKMAKHVHEVMRHEHSVWLGL